MTGIFIVDFAMLIGDTDIFYSSAYRRAAHFALFQADDEEEVRNAHTGGTEVMFTEKPLE